MAVLRCATEDGHVVKAVRVLPDNAMSIAWWVAAVSNNSWVERHGDSRVVWLTTPAVDEVPIPFGDYLVNDAGTIVHVDSVVFRRLYRRL